MRKIAVILSLFLVTFVAHGASKPQSIVMDCQDYSWNDVEVLVQPYLDDVLYTALVMQGQSSNYKTSEAASQAMGESLPEVVQKILKALIKANC